MTAVFLIALCTLSLWLQWRNHKNNKLVEQACLDHGFVVGRSLGRAEANETWVNHMHVACCDVSARHELADLDQRASDWIVESKATAIRAGVSQKWIDQ